MSEKTNAKKAELEAKEAERLQAEKEAAEKAEAELLQAEYEAEQEHLKAQVSNKTSVNNTVFVALNSPNGIMLKTSKGKSVLLNGQKVGELYDYKGDKIRARFGITEVNAADFEDLQNRYKNLPMFKNETKLFVAPSLEELQAQMFEKKAEKHGKEQIDPTKTRTKSVDNENKK